MSLGFFLDSGLTVALTANLVATQKSDGTSAPVDFQIWLGDPDVGFQYQADSNPNVDQITLTVTDTAPGTGHEITEVQLATSLAGLASAVAGDPLDIGTVLLSESANAQELWIRVDDATMVVGSSTELGVQTNELRKLSV